MPLEPLKKKHIPATLQEAMRLHEAGDLDAAEALYLRILGADAKEPNALMNLSTLYSQRGAYEQSAGLLKKVILLLPKMPYVYFAYGNVLLKLECYADALLMLNHAISLDGNQASYYFNKAIAYDGLNQLGDAIEAYTLAIKLQPDNVEAHINRANNLYRLGRLEEALAAANAILAAHPALAMGYTTRGNIYNSLFRSEEALADYDRAITLQPDFAVAHNNRGSILAKNDRDQAAALASYDQAIVLNPRYADAHNNRAAALNKLERFEEALAAANLALSLNPDSALAHDARGNALTGLRRFEEALADYDRGMTLQPGLINSYWNKAMLALLMGDLEVGLKLYERRWETDFQKKDFRPMDKPLWLGEESLTSKTIFIHLEQGLGDSLQCARFIPLLAERAARVIVETPGPLIALFAESFRQPNVMIVASGTPIPVFDYQCPIMSLPLAFKVTVDTIPNTVPYLQVPPAKLAAWQQKLGPKTKRRIGLVWSGASVHPNDHNRSLALGLLDPLLQQPYEFHSLQKEVRPYDQLLMHLLCNHAADLQDFTDTAALVAQMDVVISVDTSVAHLAGALGKPLFVLLPYTPDYRWLLDRDDNPWYPTARLFRQPVRKDWPNAISRVIEALATM